MNFHFINCHDYNQTHTSVNTNTLEPFQSILLYHLDIHTLVNTLMCSSTVPVSINHAYVPVSINPHIRACSHTYNIHLYPYPSQPTSVNASLPSSILIPIPTFLLEPRKYKNCSLYSPLSMSLHTFLFKIILIQTLIETYL